MGISIVMPALDAGIHVFFVVRKVVDGRNKSGHDDQSLTKLEKITRK